MLATQIEVSDGTLHTINVGIGFFEQDDISVSLDQGDPLTEGVDYNWPNLSTVTFLNTTNTPGGFVPNGTEVIIRRRTKDDELYNVYDGGAPFSRTTMDENFKQLIYLSQEFSEGLGLDGLRNNLNMNGYRVTNLGAPIADSDAVSKGYVDNQAAFNNSRALRVPASDPAIPELPPAIQRANKLLAFDANGVPYGTIPAGGDATSLAFDLSSDERGKGIAMIARGGQVCESIADLRTLRVTDRSKNAFVTSYYGDGNGGGGAFRLDPTDTTSADNGVTIIVAADGGRWKLIVFSFISFKQSGAKGDGVHIDSPHLNALFSVTDRVTAEEGSYLQNATLKAPPRVLILGGSPENTRIVRDGSDYGNTLEFGTDSSNPSNNANACQITGIWLQRNFTYVPGVTTSIPDPLSAGTTHLSVFGGQKVIIQNCMLWNAPILVDIVSSSLVSFINVGFTSMIHDQRVPGLQEGFAAVRLRNSTVNPYHTQLVSFTDCHINGAYFSPERAVTTGSVSTPMVECVGALYGLYVEACEGLSIQNCYLGAFNINNVYCNPDAGLVTNIRFWGNFVDGSREYAFAFNCTAGNPTVGVQMYGNNFNMQLINLGAIYAIGVGHTTVMQMSIVGNHFENSVQTPVLLFSAEGVLLADNTFASYNVRRGGDANSLYAAGILVGGSSTRVFAHGNAYGGNVNNLGGGNGCRWGIYYDSDGQGSAHNEVDLGRSLAGPDDFLVWGGAATPVSPNQLLHPAASGNASLRPMHHVYIRTGTATAATLVGLPANPVMGQEHLFKDRSNATAFPIVIQDVNTSPKTIDGATNLNITTTNGFVRLRYNGTEWNRIG